MFHQEHNNTKSTFTQWIKDKFSNIFQEIALLEEVIKVMEIQFGNDPLGIYKPKMLMVHTELNLQLGREEQYGMQKTGLQQFKDGEKILYFYTIVRGRRSRLKVNKIQNDEKSWLEYDNIISEVAVNSSRNSFQKNMNVKFFISRRGSINGMYIAM